MKKLSFILSSTLALGLLAACGQNAENDTNTNEVNAEAENAEELNENNSNNTDTGNENMNEDDNVSEVNENETNENEAGTAENNEANDADASVEEETNETNETHEADDTAAEENNTEDEANNADPADNNAAEEEESNTNESTNDTEDNTGAEDNQTADEEAAHISPLYLYFADADLLNTYRVNGENEVSNDEAGAMEAMDLWAAGPVEEELYSLLPEGAVVQYVELNGDEATVSLSPEIEDANLGSSGEGMLAEQIAMMMEQFDASTTMILIDGESEGSFLGHMELGRPIEAGSPEDYDLFE